MSKKGDDMSKKLTKRKLKEQIKEELYSGLIQPVTAYQKCPNTFVILSTKYQDQVYDIMGFSKVCWPDRWNAEYGVGMAIEKAISDLAKKLVAKEPIINLYTNERKSSVEYKGEKFDVEFS